jgi:hypothetical protein
MQVAVSQRTLLKASMTAAGRGLRQASFRKAAHLLRASVLTCIGAPRRDGPRKREVLGLMVEWESVEEVVCELSLEDVSLFLVILTSAYS